MKIKKEDLNIGKSMKVSISLRSDLLVKINNIAKEHEITRSMAIALMTDIVSEQEIVTIALSKIDNVNYEKLSINLREKTLAKLDEIAKNRSITRSMAISLMIDVTECDFNTKDNIK